MMIMIMKRPHLIFQGLDKHKEAVENAVEQGPYGGFGGFIFTDLAQAESGDITKIMVKAGHVICG